jgi:hypothetical protein
MQALFLYFAVRIPGAFGGGAREPGRKKFNISFKQQ